MKKTYKRIKINEDLLKEVHSSAVTPLDFDTFLEGKTHETLPKGKVIGAYYNSYIQEQAAPTDTGGGFVNSRFGFSSPISHTNIVIKDSQGHLLTNPTDLQDYHHKNGGYALGFKELDFISAKERISIEWETLGITPVCGEFVFVILVDNCAC